MEQLLGEKPSWTSTCSQEENPRPAVPHIQWPPGLNRSCGTAPGWKTFLNVNLLLGGKPQASCTTHSTTSWPVLANISKIKSISKLNIDSDHYHHSVDQRAVDCKLCLTVLGSMHDVQPFWPETSHFRLIFSLFFKLSLSFVQLVFLPQFFSCFLWFLNHFDSFGIQAWACDNFGCGIFIDRDLKMHEMAC